MQPFELKRANGAGIWYNLRYLGSKGRDTLAAIHAFIAALNECEESEMRPVPNTLGAIAALIHFTVRKLIM